MEKKPISCKLPFTSTVISIRKERYFIKSYPNSIVNNDYPLNKYEILVVGSMGTDCLEDTVKKYTNRYNNINLHDKPKRIRATVNKVGTNMEWGEIIISIDTHVLYAQTYIRQCVELLQTTGAVYIERLQKAVGFNYATHTASLVTSTSLNLLLTELSETIYYKQF